MMVQWKCWLLMVGILWREYFTCVVKKKILSCSVGQYPTGFHNNSVFLLQIVMVSSVTHLVKNHQFQSRTIES